MWDTLPSTPLHLRMWVFFFTGLAFSYNLLGALPWWAGLLLVGLLLHTSITRFFHAYSWMSYSMHELGHLCVFIWLCAYAEPPEMMRSWPRFMFVAVGYATFMGTHTLYALGMCCLRRSFRPSRHVDTSAPEYNVPTFRTFEHEARDGTKLTVRIAKSDTSSKVMLLAAPLGQCGPTTFNPIMCWFGPAFTYVTWDYRGFFGSDKPDRLRKISIPEHANDAIEVLTACGYDRADVMVGHSMGTAVTFETVLLSPERIGSLIILNGFHGHIFNTMLQLVWRIPLMSDVLARVINHLSKNPQRFDQVRQMIRPVMKRLLPMYARQFGSKMWMKIHGERYLLDFLESYLGGLCEQSNAESYAQLAQELDAHSVYHLLPSITHPVLLISGFLDFVTPAMQSFEIERQIPQAVHYCDPFSGHATIMESPEWCVAEIDLFIRDSVLVPSTESGIEGKKHR